MEEMEAFQFYDSVDHGYLQHMRCGMHGSHSLSYYIFPIPANYDLKDVIAFAYDASFSVRNKAASDKVQSITKKAKKKRRGDQTMLMMRRKNVLTQGAQ